MKRHIFLLPLLLLLSCTSKNEHADAYGNFESIETVISARGNGILKAFDIQEGETLPTGDTVGYVDTADLHLKKEQLMAQLRSLNKSLPQLGIQLQVLSRQLDHAKQEQLRIEKLLADAAATQKQKDDADAQVALLQSKYAALQSSLSVQTQTTLAKMQSVQLEMARVENKMSQSLIINPIAGTVLTKYVEPHEVVSYGKPLYSIANLNTMTLRAYITGNQLPQLKLGDSVMVLTDNPQGGYTSWRGFMSWISNRSEFTPKEIQTKKERTNRVYAIKILVKNDGRIKIGMPGEVRFSTSTTNNSEN